MAAGKNTIVVYRDWKHIFDKLSDIEAGQLIKHLFAYVNDENPQSDRLIELVFEPIKLTLKRDLKQWESTIEKRSKAGLISAEKRKQNQHMLTHVESVQQVPTNSTDSVIVIDSVIDNEKENNKKFIFFDSLVNLGVEKQIAKDWLKVRKDKKSSNTETAFNAIVKQIERSGLSANECIKIAVERSWSGFNIDWISNITHKVNKQMPPQNLNYLTIDEKNDMGLSHFTQHIWINKSKREYKALMKDEDKQRKGLDMNKIFDIYGTEISL